MKFDVSGKVVALEKKKNINTCKTFEAFTVANMNAALLNINPSDVTASHSRISSI
jgi:hypothetical protein